MIYLSGSVVIETIIYFHLDNLYHYRPEANWKSDWTTVISVFFFFLKRKTTALDLTTLRLMRRLCLQLHRIAQWLGLKGTSRDHLAQPPCSSSLHRITSRRVLSVFKEGDSTTSMGSWFQCSATLEVKKFFLSSLGPPPPVKKSYYQCSEGASWSVCDLQMSGWLESPMSPGPVIVAIPSCL